MSTERPEKKKNGPETNNGLIAIIAIAIIAFLVFVDFVGHFWVQGLTAEEVRKKQAVESQTTIKEQAELLKDYRWIDKDEGTLQLPIEMAKEKFLESRKNRTVESLDSLDTLERNVQ